MLSCFVGICFSARIGGAVCGVDHIAVDLLPSVTTLWLVDFRVNLTAVTGQPWSTVGGRVPRQNQPLDPSRSPVHLWGSEVRQYRTGLGWSLEQTGKKVFVARSYVGAIERGETRCTRALAERLDEALGAQGALFRLWEKTIENAAFPGWFDWPAYEARALALESYEGTVVYGLLQTPDYARVLLRGDETAVAARMERQKILTREDPPPPHLSVILDESVLYRRAGTAEIMRAQLEHLVSVASPRINIYIVPLEVNDGGLSGSFVVNTLDDRSEVAYIDTAVKGLTLSSGEDLTTLTRSLMALRSRALSMQDSLALIERTAEERWQV